MHNPEMTPRPSVFVISTVFASQKLGIKEVERRHLARQLQ
jgi:hypothetical protein